MRYDEKEFNKNKAYYKRMLKKNKSRHVFIYGDINREAFFSIAPLSMAASELKKDVYVSFGYKSRSYEIVFDVWETYENLKKKKIGKKEAALQDLLKEINIDGFQKFFEKSGLILKTEKSGFSGALDLDYKVSWFKPFLADKLKKTGETIVKNIFALKKNERFSVGFEVIREKSFLGHPLQDYLDSYPISYSVFLGAKDRCKSISLKASTPRDSLRKTPEKVSELMTTLLGLELEKDIPMPIFKKFKKLSGLLDLDRLRPAEATFFISGKGYHGKHIFGEKKGYPTKNMKNKWNSPGGMIYKFSWYPQADSEERDPISRVAFTDTVPIDKLVESTLVDYEKMRKRNREIGDVMNRCDRIIVKSNIKDGCDFEVGLVKEDGTRRIIEDSDSDVRTMLDPIMLARGKRTGRMANIPGGEAFTTPAYVVGRIVGDVVINIDRSWRLDAKEPFVAIAKKSGYKVISGPKDVIMAFNKRKKEAWKNILEQEKNNSLSKEIIALKKKNFNHIGEFAINTNPHASLCDYLIINEKIAKMIHVAFGSGFEPDAATEYHMDVVIDSPRQKLDIYGIDSKKEKHWIIKDGDFVL